MSNKRRFLSLVLNYRSVGGAAKMLDYALHAAFEVWFTTVTNDQKGGSLLEKLYYRRSHKRREFLPPQGS